LADDMLNRHERNSKAPTGRIHGAAKGGFALNSAPTDSRATEPGRITARQIEAARRAVTRHLKRIGRVWIRVFPDSAGVAQAAEVRMGAAGHAGILGRPHPSRADHVRDRWCSRAIAEEAFELAAAKLSVKTRFVTRLGRGH